MVQNRADQIHARVRRLSHTRRGGHAEHPSSSRLRCSGLVAARSTEAIVRSRLTTSLITGKEILMGRMRSVCLIVVAALLVGVGLAGEASAIEAGQKAPDFVLAAPGGKQVKLADLTARGPVVIYTFIQAFTGT